jgi:predicted RNase H-like nuclease (RuvC/YqgF family)
MANILAITTIAIATIIALVSLVALLVTLKKLKNAECTITVLQYEELEQQLEETKCELEHQKEHSALMDGAYQIIAEKDKEIQQLDKKIDELNQQIAAKNRVMRTYRMLNTDNTCSHYEELVDTQDQLHEAQRFIKMIGRYEQYVAATDPENPYAHEEWA